MYNCFLDISFWIFRHFLKINLPQTSHVPHFQSSVKLPSLVCHKFISLLSSKKKNSLGLISALVSAARLLLQLSNPLQDRTQPFLNLESCLVPRLPQPLLFPCPFFSDACPKMSHSMTEAGVSSSHPKHSTGGSPSLASAMVAMQTLTSWHYPPLGLAQFFFLTFQHLSCPFSVFFFLQFHVFSPLYLVRQPSFLWGQERYFFFYYKQLWLPDFFTSKYPIQPTLCLQYYKQNLYNGTKTNQVDYII